MERNQEQEVEDGKLEIQEPKRGEDETAIRVVMTREGEEQQSVYLDGGKGKALNSTNRQHQTASPRELTVSGAMEREAEWASEKEAAFGEEYAGILVRKKRDIAGGKENGSHQPEPVVAGGEQRSVYVDGDRGVWKCRHCIWTYQLSGPGIEHIQKHEGYCQVTMGTETLTQRGTYFDSPVKGILSTDGTSGMQIREESLFIDDKDNIQVNGKKDFRTKEFHNLDNSLVGEEKSNHRSTDVIPENGSTSDLTKGCDEFGVTRSEFEVEEDTHVELGKQSQLDVTEIDLEKVLEEQETHDLYCPNCNSCITKRVILRKRKRTVRETQCDTPPTKVQQLQHLDATAASADEMTELSHDREPDVFRCLSCFSFFIPTDAGFNIFRIFGRKGEAENQVTSRLLPAKTENIGSRVLKPVGSTSRASESDTSFNLFRIFGRRRETESLRSSQQLPAKNVTWNTSIFNSSASTSTTSESVSGLPLLSGSTVTSVQQKGETSMNIQASSGTTTFGAVSVGKSHITTEKIEPVAGVQFGVEPNNIFGEDPSFKEKQRPLTNVVSDAIKLDEGQSTIEEMDTDAKIWENFINDEKQVGNPAKCIIQRCIDKIESEDPNLGKGQTITDVKNWINDGKQVGDLAKDSMQKYLNKTESEDPNLGKSQPITSIGDTDDAGDDTVGPIDIITPTFPAGASHSQFSQNINVSVVSTHQTQIYVGEPTDGEAGRRRDWDVLKSIVYGGLIESVTSLSIVSSAAGGNASTLNIVALALANLIGGLFVIAHDISELGKTEEETTNQNGEPVGRYWEQLGRKANSRLHATMAVLSYILMGLLPPIIYGFSFRKSDNREYKLIAVAAASLVCISLLAIGKAHVNAQRAYMKNLAYYLSLGYAASGLSFVAGVMIHRLLDQLGLYDSSAAPPVPPSDIFSYIASTREAWALS